LVFSSYEYILLFLPCAVLGFYGIRAIAPPLSIAMLWIASFIFYASHNPSDTLILATSTLVNFAIGVVIQNEKTSERSRYLALVLGVACNLSALAFYKYANFFIATIFPSLPRQLDVALPLGISFFTFTQIAYLVDLYQKKAREYGLNNYFLFVSFFPHLIAGPVIHHKEVMPQFEEAPRAGLNWSAFSMGLAFIAIGLFKKVVLADPLSVWVAHVFGGALRGAVPSLTDGWLGTAAYTFQIYFDFSGYSDMAIGSALLFGIWLPINFNSPYQATSIADFWRRWHITLSRFLRDYLYFPLGGNRLGLGRTYVNIAIVMLLGGLWHGAAWTFVAWGAVHGAMLMLNRWWETLQRPLPSAFAWPLTMAGVVLAWVLFRSNSFTAALNVYQSMIGLGGPSLPASQLHPAPLQALLLPGLNAELATVAWIAVCAGIAFCLPNSQQIVRWCFETPRTALQLTGIATAFALLGSFSVAAISQVTEFIYFNF
jgi:alginate O-acetyltransferase complex protein AlgI